MTELDVFIQVAVYKSLVARAFSSLFEKLTLAWGLDDLNLVKLIPPQPATLSSHSQEIRVGLIVLYC
jgi:hypothetical protein